MQNDGVGKTLTVAAILCVVCSVLVSGAAVTLRPKQIENKKLDIKKKLLITSGLLDNPKASKIEILRAFEAVEVRVINIDTGEFTDDVEVENFDQLKSSKDSKMNKRIKPSLDSGKIKFREKYSFVYLIKDGGRLDQIVLPIKGKGLWSTLYGFVSLEVDTKTVRGLGFYQHGETPGLGGEVDNPRWKASWAGKVVFDNDFNPNIKVIKGMVDPTSPKAKSQIDGLSGATITSVGVQGLVNYWMGQDGFGPFLKNIREGGIL